MQVIETVAQAAERIAGAEAALAVLRAIEAHNREVEAEFEAGNGSPDLFDTPRHAFEAALAAAGPIEPRLAGFIGALAEAFDFCTSTGYPNLRQWRPWSGMSDQQRGDEQAEFDNAMRAELAARNNVVQLARAPQ